MNRILLAMACVLASGAALAQAPPPDTQSQTMPPGNYQSASPQSAAPGEQSASPQSAAPDESSSGAPTSSADKKTQMKECVAQQEKSQSSTGMSKSDIKKYCKNQVNNASSESAPH
jgi:hypothetical protein